MFSHIFYKQDKCKPKPHFYVSVLHLILFHVNLGGTALFYAVYSESAHFGIYGRRSSFNIFMPFKQCTIG